MKELLAFLTAVLTFATVLITFLNTEGQRAGFRQVNVASGIEPKIVPTATPQPVGFVSSFPKPTYRAGINHDSHHTSQGVTQQRSAHTVAHTLAETTTPPQAAALPVERNYPINAQPESLQAKAGHPAQILLGTPGQITENVGNLTQGVGNRVQELPVPIVAPVVGTSIEVAGRVVTSTGTVVRKAGGLLGEMIGDVISAF